MEDILASIKRIIADDSQVAHAPTSRVEPLAAAAEPVRFVPPPLHLIEPALDDATLAAPPKEEVLELTQPLDNEPIVPEPVMPEPVTSEPAMSEQADAEIEPLDLGVAAASAAALAQKVPPPAAPIVSDDATLASRQSLAALSALLVKPEPGDDNTLEGLVREMLRPMMKEWLDQRLPELVERLVEREIARITGRLP